MQLYETAWSSGYRTTAVIGWAAPLPRLEAAPPCHARRQTVAGSAVSIATNGVRGQRSLRLDFCDVKYLTSTVLGKLVSVHKQVKHAGGHFQIVNVGPEVYDMFKVTRLNTFIDVKPVEGPQPRLVV